MTGTQSVEVEFDLDHSPAKVWRTLTEPALLARWVMPNDIVPKVGHRFQFRNEPTEWWDGIVDCEVRVVETQKRLEYSWAGGPPNMRIDTLVSYTLTPTATGTKLRIVQSGFVPGHRFAFEGAKKGWDYMLTQKLPTLLAELN
jgi:uncharacterized protein YndB with AHSA1/START domain